LSRLLFRAQLGKSAIEAALQQHLAVRQPGEAAARERVPAKDPAQGILRRIQLLADLAFARLQLPIQFGIRGLFGRGLEVGVKQIPGLATDQRRLLVEELGGIQSRFDGSEAPQPPSSIGDPVNERLFGIIGGMQ